MNGISLRTMVSYNIHLPRPRYERDRFSGGRNLSAEARNRARERECSDVFYMQDRDTLIVPKWMKAQFESQWEQFKAKVRAQRFEMDAAELEKASSDLTDAFKQTNAALTKMLQTLQIDHVARTVFSQTTGKPNQS